MPISFHSMCLITFNCLLKSCLYFYLSNMNCHYQVQQMKQITYGNSKQLYIPNPQQSFPKGQAVSFKILLQDFICRCCKQKTESLHFYCYPTSSDLLTLLKIVAKMIHINSFILLLVFCPNKSILKNLMKQYVLGGSFEDFGVYDCLS